MSWRCGWYNGYASLIEWEIGMIVGLTGGIGSGKSAVSCYLKKLGVVLVDADQVAREVVIAGSPALAKIAAHFGQQVLMSDGNLDRSVLRQNIFSNKAQKNWLEALLHPLIAASIDTQLAAATGPYAVLESPLLLETQQHTKVDFIVVVDASEAQQLQRASVRDNNSGQQIRAIMASQMQRQQRLDRAHWVLDNHQDLTHLQQQVAQLHQHLCQLTETPT